MSGARESLTLPLVFLTVTLLGGVRVATSIQLLPPPLISVVLGLLLLIALARAGTVAPDRLVDPARSLLDNASGAIVLASCLAASAQIFNLVTPDHGLLHVLFSVCFAVQLLTTLAGVSGRTNMLRSVAVLIGAAFVMRFVVLEGIYAESGGVVQRVVTALAAGASLGTVSYEPHASVTGYLAFATIALYLFGLILLPGSRSDDRDHRVLPLADALRPVTLPSGD